MTTLLTYAGPVDATAAVTRTGGVPLVPDGFDWPACAACSGAMQFVAQVFSADLAPGGREVLSVFMCQNDPGLCEEWDAASGGNRALVFAADGLAAATVPPGETTLLPGVSGVGRAHVDVSDYDEARTSWCEASGRAGREVLGQLGGEPSWLQNDEAPDCPSCAKPMGFVAQLEEGHDFRTEINFGGGGCGYAFACRPCAQASFLWQC